MNKIIKIHLAFLVVVLISLGLVYNRYWNVATVNGVAISRLEYINAMERLGGKQTLDSMIDDALILNEGKVKGVTVDQKTVDEEIAKIEEKVKAQNETLEAALTASGMTRTDLEKQIRMRKIQESLSAPKTEITQTQIDEFLKTNKAMLPTGKTKEELQALAKEELISQANQEAAIAWMDELRKNAKIEYK